MQSSFFVQRNIANPLLPVDHIIKLRYIQTGK